jgi:hypothetical protein
LSNPIGFPGGDASVTPLGIGISLAFDLASALVSHLKRAKLPQDLVDAAQATVDQILAHKDDVMTKEQWEALRG